MVAADGLICSSCLWSFSTGQEGFLSSEGRPQAACCELTSSHVAAMVEPACAWHIMATSFIDVEVTVCYSAGGVMKHFSGALAI